MELERELKLFDVFLNEEQLTKRLEKTQPYAGVDKQNCSNLVLVLLGIVEPEYYLNVCTRRRKVTSIGEIISYTKASLSQCGIDGLIEERLLTVQDSMTLFRKIPTNHAIPLGVYWKDGRGHSALLRKNSSGVLEYIDPQIMGGFGNVYPFKLTGDLAVQTYFTTNVHNTSLLFSYVGIDEAISLSEKCMTTQSPMDLVGGKKRIVRKNGKKTKKGRKHHAVRTRRRRY